MGSASQPMLVVKANRALLKKRRTFKDIREQYENYVGQTELEFKALTEFEKKKIRDKIIAQAKIDRLRQLNPNYALENLLQHETPSKAVVALHF